MTEHGEKWRLDATLDEVNVVEALEKEIARLQDRITHMKKKALRRWHVRKNNGLGHLNEDDKVNKR